MQLKKVTQEIRTTTMAFAGETLQISYYTRAVKLKDLLDPPDTTDQAAVIHFTASMLARRLAKWDLLDGKEVVPFSYDSLLDLPPDFINAVLEAINKDGAPGEATGSN